MNQISAVAIILCGPPGVGKSTLARELQFPVFEVDNFFNDSRQKGDVADNWKFARSKCLREFCRFLNSAFNGKSQLTSSPVATFVDTHHASSMRQRVMKSLNEWSSGSRVKIMVHYLYLMTELSIIDRRNSSRESIFTNVALSIPSAVVHKHHSMLENYIKKINSRSCSLLFPVRLLRINTKKAEWLVYLNSRTDLRTTVCFLQHVLPVCSPPSPVGHALLEEAGKTALLKEFDLNLRNKINEVFRSQNSVSQQSGKSASKKKKKCLAEIKEAIQSNNYTLANKVFDNFNPLEED
eukprot:GHVP01010025.1.p1 GENE.GHVP01010025.1~~GHVP01010025.1.p1  ORF type:complete len:295 (-),score=33.71 GHVP01010025.1:463-1347(-)